MVFITIVTGANLNQLITRGPRIVRYLHQTSKYYGSTPLTQSDDPPTSFRHEFIPSGDLLHSHGSHGPFIDDVSIKASIYKGFSMAMLVITRW